MRYRLGTRGSRLALAQGELVKTALSKATHGAWNIETVVIHTQGDRDRTTPLASAGGQGVFVKEIESALLAGKIDFAVHSLKDVPFQIAAGTTLAAFLPRENPLDALVAPPGIHHWRELPHGARVGTGSPRRIAQLRSLRPDLECVPIRGNVETRIAKVDSGELAAIVLGCAGLLRLGFANRISYAFPPEEMVGAAGQGIVSVQCLEPQESNRELIYKLSEISDAEAAEAALKEREALAALGGGCQTPMGALWRNGKLWRF